MGKASGGGGGGRAIRPPSGLDRFNWHMMSSLRNNDVITVKMLGFNKNLSHQS